MSGNNFGLNDSLKYYEFVFDSWDTNTTPDGSAATSDWPLFLLGKPLTNVAAIKILEAQIPFTWNVFNSTNNTFTLTENGTTSATITIPAGNYTSTTFTTELGALLTAASGETATYNATYSSSSSNPETQQLLVYVTTANLGSLTTFFLTFGAAGNSGNTNPRRYMGFNAGASTSSVASIPAWAAISAPGTGISLTSPNAMSITGPNYVYVNSNKMGQLCNFYLPLGAANLGNGQTGPQMAKIPVNVQPGGIIYWQDPDPQKWFDLESLPNFANIDFYLTLGNTSAQKPLQLNGLNFSLKLGVLVNAMVHTDTSGGLAHNERVVKRLRPR